MHPERIYQLWDELSDFGLDAVDEALNHCLARLCTWLDADNAFWIGSVRVISGAKARRDIMLGWRARAIQLLDASGIDRERQKESIRRLNKEDPGATTLALLAQAGRFRAHRLHAGELVDFEAFRRTDHYDYYYRQLDISDRLWVVFPVSDDAECYYCIDKYGKRRRFSESDLALAATVMRGVKWFHRQLMLSHGLGIADAPLTGAERRTLQALVTGEPVKTIARRLGVTPGTAQQYTNSVYRKFGVRSRAELLAVWLNRCA